MLSLLRTHRFAALVAAPLLLAGAIIADPQIAGAADFIVSDARAATLKPGQQVAAGDRIQLNQGERVTLIASDGRTVKLKGPFDGAPPSASSDGASVTDSLKSLIASQSAGTATLGVVRSGSAETDKPLPAPWLVNVSQPGARCVMSGQPVVFWKPETSAEATPFVISPADRTWSAKASWPAGSDQVAASARLPVVDGQAMIFALGDKEATLTMRVMPVALANNARMQAAWMNDQGCTDQAIALVKQAQIQ